MSKATPHADHLLARIVFFSDAGFAVAITLLVIEIPVPHLPHDTDPRLALNALIALWPSLFGIVLSFLAIGRFWIGHHNALGVAAGYDRRLVWPNLVLLMAIAFMPFTTAYLAGNLGQLVPTLVYNAVLALTAAISCRVVWLATDRLRDGSDALRSERRALRRRGASVILAALTALACTPLSPAFSQLALLTMPLWYRRLVTAKVFA